MTSRVTIKSEADARYWAGEGEDHEYGTPDEDSPEWTADDYLWAADARDFGGFDACMAFLQSREEFLDRAAAVGIPRETFLPFEPSKPGFEERAKALMSLPKAVGWAAE